MTLVTGQITTLQHQSPSVKFNNGQSRQYRHHWFICSLFVLGKFYYIYLHVSFSVHQYARYNSIIILTNVEAQRIRIN